MIINLMLLFDEFSCDFFSEEEAMLRMLPVVNEQQSETTQYEMRFENDGQPLLELVRYNLLCKNKPRLFMIYNAMVTSFNFYHLICLIWRAFR